MLIEGLPVLAPGSKDLHVWQLTSVDRFLTLREGSVGFVMAFVAERFNKRVERLDMPAERNGGIDDGGYAARLITGGTTPTKHQTGAAMDLNWHLHGYNTRPTASFSDKQLEAIEAILASTKINGYEVVEWGGHWPSHEGSSAKPDPMHFQVSSHVETNPIGFCELLAHKWMRTKLGERLLAANPGQERVIKA